MPQLDHETLLARQRCTAQFAELGVDPIGSAGSPPGGYVLFELPLPWPHDVLSLDALADLGAVTKAMRARPQALVPEGADGSLRVIAYGPGRPGGAPLLRREDTVGGVGELADAAHRLLTDVSAGIVDDPDGTDPVWDVLVCTHGTRDVCCGAVGSALHHRLCEADAGLRGPGGERVRVWRTSHTGGHRFAPTVVTFPDGLTWAWIDKVDMAALLARRVAPDEAAAHLRGAATVRGGWAQALDREGLRGEGWAWVAHARTVLVDEPVADGPDSTHVVVVEGVGAVGERVRYRGVVEVAREVPVPPCGVPLEEAVKTDREFAVHDVQREA